MKTCVVCGFDKDESEFYILNSSVNGRRYYQSGCKDCRSKRAIQDRKDKPAAWAGYQRKAALKRLYGISQQDYDRLLAAQNGACAICGALKPEPLSSRTKYFHVDHDHITTEVRGLLCVNCNRGLGMLQDDESLVLKAYEYLRRNRGSREIESVGSKVERG